MASLLIALLLYNGAFVLFCLAYHVPGLSRLAEAGEDFLHHAFAPFWWIGGDSPVLHWFANGFSGSRVDYTGPDPWWIAAFAVALSLWSLIALMYAGSILGRRDPRHAAARG